MGRLFRRAPPAADHRPAMMAIISLMVLLLPLLISSTSSRKLAGLPLGVPGPADELPPEKPGPVEGIEVRPGPAGGFVVQAKVRATDVRASAGDVELRRFTAPDLAGLQGVLATLKALDPARERLLLVPAPTTTADEVVRWMDAVRAGPQGPLFPKVVLEQVTTAPAAAPPEAP